ncbi:MAG TPA: hypothetical protein VMT42_01865 [candidate division Zixibacteria bacterium]|nr:hypothetical protein [candidate division Zixibacteria bacterium]
MRKRVTAIIIFLPIIIALWILAWILIIMGSAQTTNQAAAFFERTESIIRTMFLKP